MSETKVSPRQKLLQDFGTAIYTQAHVQLHNGRNMKKGDNWKDMTWFEISEKLEEEMSEVIEELGSDDTDRLISECADLFNVMCMAIDKATSERESLS